MRLTINLDDDLYAMARSHAIATKTSLSKAVGNLLRQKTSSPTQGDTPGDGLDKSLSIDPETLLPVVRSVGRIITMEDVQRALDDEDDRYLEAGGWKKPKLPQS